MLPIPTRYFLVVVKDQYLLLMSLAYSLDSRKIAVKLLLKASGFLDYCVRCIHPNLPLKIRKSLPNCLQQWVLEAISIQALAQGLEKQLGMALGSEKASLSVKRRLACEAVVYLTQAQHYLSGCGISDKCGTKLLLFFKWKYLEAKVAAYYYHGMVIDKGTTPNCYTIALCCFLLAEELLVNCNRARLSFCMSVPVTSIMQYLPQLPEFSLSLRPEDYELPEIDSLWNKETYPAPVQSLMAYLQEDDNEMEI